jgi:hypothetical protein
MSYYIRDKEDYFIVVDSEEKQVSKHKTRLSAGNALFKRMVKDKLRKKKKVVPLLVKEEV